MPQILYQPDFDDIGCDNPACSQTAEGHTGPIHLQQHCHPGAGMALGYLGGVLYVACRYCQRPVALIAVKERPDG